MSSTSLNPSIIYFTHSRIRKQFSGCGKMISQTLSDLRFNPKMIENIPKIKVIYDHQNDRYISMNNRRLYVFKKLYEEGLIKEIPVYLEINTKSKLGKNEYSLNARLI